MGLVELDQVVELRQVGDGLPLGVPGEESERESVGKSAHEWLASLSELS